MIKEMIGEEVRIKFSNKTPTDHYTIVPYNFSPRLGKKLVSNSFIDLGQGMLQVIEEIHNKTLAEGS